MKNKTIAIIASIIIALVAIYSLSPYLSYWSLKEAIVTTNTKKIDDLVQGAVLKFNLRDRIRDALYEQLLANNGQMLKDLDKARLKTTATVMAEQRVQQNVDTGQLVYVILDPMIQDEDLIKEVTLAQAHEMVSDLLNQAVSRRQGTNKFIVSVSVPHKDGSMYPVELWFDRYGTVWRVTDVKYANQNETVIELESN